MNQVIEVAAVVGAVGAAATAASVFYTALQFRHRPEVSISWAFGGEAWPSDRVVEIAPGTRSEALVAVRNAGDATGEATMTNTIVADVFELTDSVGTPGQRSGNPIAGRHTEGRVNFLCGERRFFPNMTWINGFTIFLGDATPTKREVEYEVVFVIEDQRFSTHGKRWFKFWAFPLEEHLTTTKVWRRIMALPSGEVVCGPGYRRSTRRVKIVDAAPATSGFESGPTHE
jgi:hypothetical protein